MIRGLRIDPALARRYAPVLLACLVHAGCPDRNEVFGAGERSDPTPATDDDDVTGDDDDTVAPDDDDTGALDDDDSVITPYDDPCGSIYQPQSGTSADAPVPATYLEGDVGLTPTPRRIRTGLHGDPASSLTVMWVTDLDTEATLIQWGEDVVEENIKVGATFVRGTYAGAQFRLHEVRLCDLEPGTTLLYRVGGEGAWSETYEYTTFDPAAEDLSFVIAGDSRGGNDDLGEMLAMAAVEQPRLLLHTGDMVGTGSSLDDWDQFWKAAEPTLTGIPLVTAIGNHEGMGEEVFAQLASPGNEQWYSADFGPLHVAVLNDSAYQDVLLEQAEWLDDDLTASTAPFTLVATHRPLWSSGSHGPNENLQEVIGPVLDAHGVDLVVVGHDHGYERTVPLVGSAEMPSAAGGTVYITSGGGGASLYTFTGDWFTAYYEASLHYIHVSIEGETLTLNAYRLDGSLMDTFVKEI